MSLSFISLRFSGTGVREAEAEGWVFFALSLSLSLQLAAFSPRALAIPHRPRRLGGIGGFSPFDVGVIDVGSNVGTSSSHTFSTIPVRINAQREHVVRSRARHQVFGHSGYIVVDCGLGLP